MENTFPKVAYENPWIKVSHEEVLTPTGSEGIYGTVHFKNAAIGIIPIDNEGNTWLVGQYRFALGKYSWEIPEGGGPVKGDVLESAKRELQEEVGLKAEKWTKIAEFNTSNSVTDEYAVIYLAQELSPCETNHDDTEDLQILKISFVELFEKVVNGEIMDSLTIIAVFKLKYLMEKGEI